MVRPSMRVTATTDAPRDTPADTVAVGVFDGEDVAHDTSGGYRAYRVSLLRGTNLEGFYSKGYSFQEEMLLRCKLAGARIGENLHRGRRETEAESVAHIVCNALGLDTAAYSDAYVMGWADGDMDLVKQCAQTVLRVAKQILTDLTPAPTDPDPNPDDLADLADLDEPSGLYLAAV